MTDDELIATLRDLSAGPPSYLQDVGNAAADRIEALVKEWSKDGDEILSLREKVAKLRGALERIVADDQHQSECRYWEKEDGHFAKIARAALTTEERHG